MPFALVLVMASLAGVPVGLKPAVATKYTAAELSEATTKLNMGLLLEKEWDIPNALAYYREVVADYPGTVQARKAQERIDALTAKLASYLKPPVVVESPKPKPTPVAKVARAKVERPSAAEFAAHTPDSPPDESYRDPRPNVGSTPHAYVDPLPARRSRRSRQMSNYDFNMMLIQGLNPPPPSSFPSAFSDRTQYVSGHFRSNGHYVEGYYRSPPR